MSEERPLPLIEHRFVDRMKSPYTDETQEDLEHKGFSFVASKPIDTSIGKEFDALVREYRNALADLMEDREPLSKTPPKKDASLDLRTFILMWLKAGYEVRFVKSEKPATVDIFARFDLDRFLSRSETRETDERGKEQRLSAGDLLDREGYRKDAHPYLLRHWGDYDAQIAPERRREYAADARTIETRMRTLIAENNDVRLTEMRQGGLSHLTVYHRPRMPFEHSDAISEPHFSIITIEHPDHLKDQGFHFVKNFSDDGSIQDKNGGVPDRVLRVFVALYWAAARRLLETGLPRHEFNPTMDTLKDRILHFRRKGDDVRLIRGVYNDRTQTIDERQSAHYALFSRFDLGMFFAAPHVLSKEFVKKGYRFDRNLPFHAWGDALAALPRIPEHALYENAEIEKYIQLELSKGVLVRLLRGAYDATKKDMDPTQKYVACFTR